MSTQSPDAGPDESNGVSLANRPLESLSCNGCRQAKVRCSRDRPSCAHCRKGGMECVYEMKRVKPGLKAGAVENLHRRLDALEKLVHDRDSNTTASPSPHLEHVTRDSPSQDSTAYNILALLARELPKLVNAASPNNTHLNTPSERIEGTSKRRRLQNTDEPAAIQSNDMPQLPSPEVLESIVAAYFTHVHPWIPMIHQARFRYRFDAFAAERDKLEVVLYAMVIAASKFVLGETLSIGVLALMRRWVVWKAMDDLSLDSLQALIILSFTDIGDGNAAKAWSIIGSLTRTVEYSQLSQEHEREDECSFCQPYNFLDYTDDWTELEERRRIFWNVFNLDRFCSVSMGWNTSLTSDDVHRRLPCDGPLWRKRTPVVTPYFGIWDKAAGRIGKPIAFLPHYQSPGQPVRELDVQNQGDATSPGGSFNDAPADMSTVGAFAYCVEATESMSRITTYFLQQKINVRKQTEIESWLTRFKELDLRLVHWKMFLPQKWKTSMERQSTLMDPNLTLAHVTHNTSMILLHQLIAYPPVNWGFRKRLPSSWSAETCCSAGIEIAKITQNYLNNSIDRSPVSSSYAFCVYIAARMFLIDWKYNAKNELAPEFWHLVQSLKEMSRRWAAFLEQATETQDLFSKYAARLEELQQMCATDTIFKVRVMDYTNEIDHRPKTHSGGPQSHLHTSNQQKEPSLGQVQWTYETATAPGAVSSFNIAAPISPQEISEFNTIPQMMLDQQFMDIDRVIAFDDGSMFAANMDHNTW